MRWFIVASVAQISFIAYALTNSLIENKKLHSYPYKRLVRTQSFHLFGSPARKESVQPNKRVRKVITPTPRYKADNIQEPITWRLYNVEVLLEHDPGKGMHSSFDAIKLCDF